MTKSRINTNGLTFEGAYQIQNQNLSIWRGVLKKSVYEKLVELVNLENEKGYKDPYDVCRGDGITSIVKKLCSDIYHDIIKINQYVIKDFRVYLDNKEVFSGSISDCFAWIEANKKDYIKI